MSVAVSSHPHPQGGHQGRPWSGRRWFKHVVYAQGLYLGYGADVYPGLAEAIRSDARRRGLKGASCRAG